MTKGMEGARSVSSKEKVAPEGVAEENVIAGWSEPTREEKDELIGLMVALRDRYKGKPRAAWCQSIISAISTPENLSQEEIKDARKIYGFLLEESESAFREVRDPELLKKIGPLLDNIDERIAVRLARR